MLRNKTVRSIGFLTLVVVFGSQSGYSATKITFDKKKTVVQEIKVKGDLRLRQENFDNPPGTADRQRQRMRLRIGVDIKLPHNLKIKTRFASGEDDQVSTNQTLTDNSDPKYFFIDRAYLNWTPLDWAAFNAGKQGNPHWRPYSYDIMYDTDYNPEGLSEIFEGLFGTVGLGASFGQFVIEERSSNTKDAYLFSSQGTVEHKLPANSRIKAAAAYHAFPNISIGGIGGKGTLATNTSGASFNIAQFTAAINSWIMGVPVVLDGSYLSNNSAPKTTVGGALSTPEEQGTGYQAGFRVGKAKKKNNWEGAIFWKYIEKDAAVSGITDSDFPGTTNAKGGLGWIAYAITDFMKAQVKYFDAKPIYTTGSRDSTKRTQIDLITKF